MVAADGEYGSNGGGSTDGGSNGGGDGYRWCRGGEDRGLNRSVVGLAVLMVW